jgi:hypothetical protein
VAKARKRTRKTGAKKKAARRPVRRKAARKKVELRPLRRQIEAHHKALRGAEQTRAVKNAIRRLQRCLAEIEGICGPDMMVPLA